MPQPGYPPIAALKPLYLIITYAAALPVIFLAFTTTACTVLYLATHAFLGGILDLFYYAESEVVAKLSSLLSSEESTAGEEPTKFITPFQRLSPPPHPSSVGIPPPHGPLGTAITFSDSQNQPLARVPGSPSDSQTSPDEDEYFPNYHITFDSPSPADNGDWEDVNEDREPRNGDRSEVSGNMGRRRQPKRVSSTSRTEHSFVGQYEGDVDGVLPIGPRLHFNTRTHPRRRSNSPGRQAGSSDYMEY
ncbi:predicted protein [Uncinocarpus reesii 1704]|uniref:Uncharacterized protein n=1 Tax=Uncinocarpus reesii (strain UAMH 1704) TaxID=336963 RepID=C4JVE8_UNCRE|nr:uncharacterized protein UREG_06540 [Uncinocarpus reesii 1704]EEP81675.1 predicted protein [Uncinocarpus reesii 1704]